MKNREKQSYKMIATTFLKEVNLNKKGNKTKSDKK